METDRHSHDDTNEEKNHDDTNEEKNHDDTTDKKNQEESEKAEYRIKQEGLLRGLASSVEQLLIEYAAQPPGTSLWDLVAGLTAVLDMTQLVMVDGSLFKDYRGKVECKSFILQRSVSEMFGSCSIEGWLQLQLSNHCLSLKLRDLYSDKELVGFYYSDNSISMNPVYRQTFLLILEALETRDMDRLSALDLSFSPPKLPSEKSFSAPVVPDVSIQVVAALNEEVLHQPLQPDNKGGTVQAMSSSRTVPSGLAAAFRKQHRRSVSCPEIQQESSLEVNVEEGAIAEYAKEETKDKDWIRPGTQHLSVQKPQRHVKGHNRAISDSGLSRFIGVDPLVGRRDDLDSSQEIKGTWTQVVSATSGYHQKPKANQSLVSYLSESGKGSKKIRRAQLDRENAHFILSEAMIGTLEQLSFDTSLRSVEEQDESDDEIRELKEKLRLRRAEIYSAKERRKIKRGGRRGTRRMSGGVLSDGRTDTGTTDQSGSTDYSGDSGSGELDWMLDSNDEEFSKFERGSKDFIGSLRDIPEGSAEGIALSLLGQVGVGRLPPADQLPWLVSEEEAPQQLLPLPHSVPVDPDDDLKGATELRGSLVWAPPRPQIVLTVQDKPKNRVAAMYQQRWQCSGCGLRVEQRYCKSFRFCSYLGKYFCTGCHENTQAIIPARVIQDWDFKRYPVSNFSLDILSSLYTEPVFNILDLNPDVTRKVEKLKAVCNSRLQLSKLSRYLDTCRFAVDLHHRLERVSFMNPYIFSMEELFQTRFNKLGLTLRTIVGDALKHVKECELCQARGFICEGCHKGDSVFPFQGGVEECLSCLACFHRNCFSVVTGCPRCERMKQRHQKETDLSSN